MRAFRVDVPDEVLNDLHARLKRTRWADDFANESWQYGTNTAYLKELAAYWIEGYDWRKQERAINAYPQFRTEIDGVPIHFIHVRGKGAQPQAADSFARLALDVLGVSESDRSAQRSRRARRRSGGCLRRGDPMQDRALFSIQQARELLGASHAILLVELGEDNGGELQHDLRGPTGITSDAGATRTGRGTRGMLSDRR